MRERVGERGRREVGQRCGAGGRTRRWGRERERRQRSSGGGDVRAGRGRRRRRKSSPLLSLPRRLLLLFFPH
jgi:hypothetical protein